MQVDYAEINTTMSNAEYRALRKPGDVELLFKRQIGRNLNRKKYGNEATDYSKVVCNDLLRGYIRRRDSKTGNMKSIPYENEALFAVYREIINERLRQNGES